MVLRWLSSLLEEAIGVVDTAVLEASWVPVLNVLVRCSVSKEKLTSAFISKAASKII